MPLREGGGVISFTQPRRPDRTPHEREAAVAATSSAGQPLETPGPPRRRPSCPCASTTTSRARVPAAASWSKCKAKAEVRRRVWRNATQGGVREEPGGTVLGAHGARTRGVLGHQLVQDHHRVGGPPPTRIQHATPPSGDRQVRATAAAAEDKRPRRSSMRRSVCAASASWWML